MSDCKVGNLQIQADWNTHVSNWDIGYLFLIP